MTDHRIHTKELNLYSQCHDTEWSISTTAYQFAALFPKETNKRIMCHQVFDSTESLKGEFILSEYQCIVYGVFIP